MPNIMFSAKAIAPSKMWSLHSRKSESSLETSHSSFQHCCECCHGREMHLCFLTFRGIETALRKAFLLSLSCTSPNMFKQVPQWQLVLARPLDFPRVCPACPYKPHGPGLVAIRHWMIDPESEKSLFWVRVLRVTETVCHIKKQCTMVLTEASVPLLSSTLEISPY